MKSINLLCVGSLKEKFWKEAQQEYKKRIQKYCDLTIAECKETGKDAESKLLIKKTEDTPFVILCDKNGKKMDSDEFSAFINNKMETNKSVTIIIGGSDGVTDKLRGKCDYLLSFSDFTFPHQMFRIILLEQLYRAFKIANNEKYHK